MVEKGNIKEIWSIDELLLNEVVILELNSSVKTMKQMSENYSYLDGDCKYKFTQTFHHDQDVTQDQFLREVVRIQSFLSLVLVAKPRLKHLVCPTTCPCGG